MSYSGTKLQTVAGKLRYFSPKTISFWTSVIATLGFFSPNRKVRVVAGYAGLVCGLGGAGMVYERVANRAGCRREPVQVARNATGEDHASLWLHLLFGAIGLATVLKS